MSKYKRPTRHDLKKVGESSSVDDSQLKKMWGILSHSGTFKTDQQAKLSLAMVILKHQLMKNGLVATAQYMDDVQTMVGWELAGDVERGTKTINSRRGL